ncbi:hypothetical protein Pan44_22060 [Caulifigura coniformis]|uniref:Uncharacterized protein n=1 Tax=Caulifigura coniformis TaxID=2527983 RepID=A0A517SDH5_9PLAN|nr:hypothetical protein [Caulifigura coniformis]QDT54179.1 hypothetical protein Pan44_22060 [Caulifigura coniformis]
MSSTTKDPLGRSQRDPLLLGCVAFALVLGVVLAVPSFCNARRAARDSAHSALWHEVNQQLQGREATGAFPANLGELPLTYPDNGLPELLKLIDYRRDGNGCRVSTTLRGRALELRYGPTED